MTGLYPVLHQPQKQQRPNPQRNCPRGLEYLAMLDQVVIKQETHMLEVALPFEVSNKYAVCNNQGQRIFYAAEQSSFVCRQCCGYARPFVLKLLDNRGVPILHLERPCNCGAFYRHCCCCSDFIMVNCESTGEFLGKVEMKCNPCCFGYRVFDGNKQQIASIEGPCAGAMCCKSCCCQDQPFKIVDNQGTNIGQVTKIFSGLIKECCTDSDNFNATFSVNMDVKVKALLLGAAFLIDFHFFETR